MNFVLIGFKSSGKTTLGKSLAKLANKMFVDVDARIEDLFSVVAEQNLDCRKIYELAGAERFRQLESMALASLLWTKNNVVSTGGGAVLVPDNAKILAQIGLRIFVDTSFEIIEQRLSASDSPLFKSKNLQAVYAERRHLYLKQADIIFSVDQEQEAQILAENLLKVITSHARENNHGKQ